MILIAMGVSGAGKSLIGELLANLVDNPIRYNRAGGMVVVRIAADPNGARLEVEDTGPGIPAAHP